MSTASSSSGDFADICTFCSEIAGEASPLLDLGIAQSRADYILWESDYFVAVPCLGPLTDWYVLLVAKRHTLSSGWMGDIERIDLHNAIETVSRLLQRRAKAEVTVFEHGSFDFRNKGGACQDHAHIHLVATNRDIEELLAIVRRDVNLTPVEDWLTAAAVAVQTERASYLAISTVSQSYIAGATGAPSQFFRRSLCEWLGVEQGGWDWLAYPNETRLRRMIEERLSG